MNEVCPICGDKYTEQDIKVVYHVEYRPEITTDACTGCNLAEYLIRHQDQLYKYPYMKHKMEIVRDWTLKNRPLIN